MSADLRTVLLIGNGINRIGNNYSWEDLMKGVHKFAGIPFDKNLLQKPFPLLFEEIVLHSDKKELEIKKEIARLTTNIQPNELHQQIGKLPIEDILTTNYDYNLDVVDGKPGKQILPVKGTKFSMLRRRDSNGKKIWHLHGEASAPSSILLGYEQYGGYLQFLRNYWIDGLQYKDKKLSSLKRRVDYRRKRIESWMDHFFLSNMHVIGFGFEFTEIHLWWILSKRARIKKDKPGLIPNTIFYHCPKSELATARVDLLKSYGLEVKTYSVKDNDYGSLYKRILNKIGQELS